MIDALCCACGTIRQVSRQAYTSSGNRRLKCRSCGAMTMHAMVLGLGWPHDWREDANARHENWDDRFDLAGSQPPLPEAPAEVPSRPVKADPFDAVRALGTRVYWVMGLEEEVIYCPCSSAAFVRAGLSEESRRSAAEWLIGEVTMRHPDL